MLEFNENLKYKKVCFLKRTANNFLPEVSPVGKNIHIINPHNNTLTG